jgi:transposase
MPTQIESPEITPRMVQRWCKAMDIKFQPSMLKNLLTDAQWATISPVLPAEPEDSQQPANRLLVEGFLLLIGHGVLWEAWPAELGSARRAFQRVMQWAFVGVWAEIAKLLPRTTVAGELVHKLVAEYNENKVDHLPFITDAQWATIAPLLPAEPKTPQLTNRQFVEEVQQLYLSGGLWDARSPEQQRALDWTKQGVWNTISAQLPPGSEISMLFLVVGHEAINL